MAPRTLPVDQEAGNRQEGVYPLEQRPTRPAEPETQILDGELAEVLPFNSLPEAEFRAMLEEQAQVFSGEARSVHEWGQLIDLY